MLVQLPRSQKGTPVREPAAFGADARDTFEAGLRRDLASAPVLSCDPAIGGWRKRAVDLALTIATAPLWGVLMMALAVVADLRRLPVFVTARRIGHGGKEFASASMTLRRPSADIVQLHPQGGAHGGAPAAAKTAPSRLELAERLPEMFSVLRGEMSLVGPRPLSPEELDQLTKGGRKAYVSTRPGLFALSDVEEEGPLSAQYKHYAQTWGLSGDFALMGEVLWRSLRGR